MTAVVAPEIDLEITQGSDWSCSFGLSSRVLTWKPVAGITRAAPAVLNVVAHGMPDNWPFWIEGVGGMRQIIRTVKDDEPWFSSLVDSDHIAIPDLSSWDFDAWTSGGSIGYYTPVSLAGATARMQFRSSPGQPDPALISLVSPTNIVVDDTLKTITPTILAAATALIDWNRAQYDLELVTLAGTVIPVARGVATIVKEITK
jgi:hypothetical protein